MRTELVNLTNDIACEAGFEGLWFERGEIASSHVDDIDVLIALHACDTATDDAIAAGIRSGAKTIVCAPCCHKQLRKSIQPPAGLPVYSYGILIKRQAEILTDTLRALIMEKHGYKSHIQEFIDIGHTPKNPLLTGVKTNKRVDIRTRGEKIESLKRQFCINYYHLELLLHPKSESML